MLGSDVFSKLSKLDNVDTLPCYREQLYIDNFGRYKSVYKELILNFKPDYVINCVAINHRKSGIAGLIQQLVANGHFPRYLANKSKSYGYFLVHVSTDGVFFGIKGNYIESDPRYPRTVYSLSKILGEKKSDSVLIIRSSLVGKSSQIRNYPSLLNWFDKQENGAFVSGFVNHFWNGVTTDYFARLMTGIVASRYRLGGVQHFIPSDVVSKSELLEIFRQLLHREDVHIQPSRAKNNMRRNLNTQNPQRNELFWKFAGLPTVPSVRELLNNSFSE